MENLRVSAVKALLLSKSFPMKESLSVVSEEVKRVLQQNRVILAFVFGSAATGRTTRSSDLDLAVLLDEAVPERKYFAIRLRLLDQLSRVIKGRHLDVAVLNSASPLLVQLVLTRGKVIFCQDKDLKAEFQIKALQEFEDALYLRKTYYRYLEERVRQNKLGEIHES